jgi:hypothetical protein
MTTRKAPTSSQVSNKRAKIEGALDTQLDEHRCPITLELMVDPVVAPDGRLYEREAITRWLATHDRSPATNRVMTGELVACHPVRNGIEALIAGGCASTSDEGPWQMRRGRFLEARGDANGAGACYGRARALGYDDHQAALSLLEEAATSCPDAKRALEETKGAPWRAAAGLVSWGPGASRRYDSRCLDVVVSSEHEVDVDSGWTLDTRASTKSALVWRHDELGTVWWVRARRRAIVASDAGADY